MIDTLYIEEGVEDHPKVSEIVRRLPSATRVRCRRYGEIFNRRSQSFRLQKRRPALILARKHDGHVLETPPGYGIGTPRNFYFSHMLNCPYDCRYCFLQGMYRSAHYVLFVNYEDFEESVDARLEEAAGERCTFFSGYDCDSLAFEGISGFVERFLPFFRQRSGAWLELRTKSAHIEPLLERQPFERCVVAFSFTPDAVARRLEHRAAGVGRRIAALQKVAERGWPVGLRLDPLIYTPRFRDQYRELLSAIFARLPESRLHSVSLGPFRLPRAFHRNLVRHYPFESFLAGPVEGTQGLVSYSEDLEAELVATCTDLVLEHTEESKLFPCS